MMMIWRYGDDHGVDDDDDDDDYRVKYAKSECITVTVWRDYITTVLISLRQLKSLLWHF